MYLKRLEIQGFKTFATRTVFEFHPGITAVIGPNGSGKSNFGDGLRWVLGEQSFATLRCKRTEELLFGGGTRRPPAGLAEVSLTLDNSDRLLPLDFDEVTITRRATRAGENEYFINRARVRLRDVLQAVEPLGGAYTIVNQGLVDTALTLRPEERRRLFEDAAEIGGFEARKAEAERRLRETEGNLQRVADLVAELEPRLRSLKRQAAQARQQRELSAELHGLLATHYARLWQASHAALVAAEQAERASEQVLEQARSDQQGSVSALQALRRALRELRERLGGLHQQSSALHQRAQAAQRDLAVGGERLAALGRQLDEQERTRQESALREAEARREHEGALATLREVSSIAEQRRSELRALKATQSEREAERGALARQLSQAQDAALKAASALASQRSRSEQLLRQRERLLQEQQGQQATLQAAEQRLEQAHIAHEQARIAHEQARVILAEAQSIEDQARAALDARRQARASSEEQLAQARRALADAEARRDSLERLARSYAGAFAGVKAAMQWAEQARRPGFVLVASLLRTPPELETAIEVALGSRLQNVVVEQWQDAEDAIAQLKRSNAGRATFLPLDSIRRTMDDRPQTIDHKQHTANEVVSQPDHRPSSIVHRPPSVLGLAAELVGYDEHYRVVVWYLLGRTLVVEDLAAARREVQRGGGFSIVTLGGDQVSGGGAVTGGAQTRETGTLRRERELRELPHQVEAARKAAEAAQQARSAADTQFREAEATLRQAEAQRRELGRDADTRRAALEQAQQGVVRAEQELGWQRSRNEAAAQELAALDEQQGRSAEAVASAEASERTAQQQLAELRARQEAQAGSDNAAQQQLALLRATLADAEAQLNAGRTLATGHQNMLERLAHQRQEALRRQEELVRERDTLSKRRSSAEAEHAVLLEQIDALRQQIGPAEEAFAEHEARQPALEAAETACSAALVQHEAGYGRAALETQRARDRIETLRERAASDGIGLEEGSSAAVGDEARAVDAGDLQSTIHNLKSKIERLGTINPLALEEYEEAAERHGFLSSQLADIEQAQAALRELISELEAMVHERFTSTFSAVAAEFEQSFTRLFGGGTAQLSLVQPASESAESSTNGQGNGANEPPSRRAVGVEIIARPPGKRQQNISLLSGGERALTAAALLFAILKVNPSPFCVLDEVDAALDESNVGRFREALQALTAQTQFILITHNRGTIEAADTIYGVSMGEDGSSRVLSLRLEELISEGA